jgi:Zn-dependent M28 family amino/carboxypeptidase
LALPLLARWRGRRGRPPPRALVAALLALVFVPFSAMWWFHAAGSVLRDPSPGALDNGGSLAALLRLSQRLAERTPGPSEVRIVFLAAEEERTLGSWAYAQTLAGRPRVAVVNLESIGASDSLALVLEDGWATRRFASPPQLVAFVNRAAQEAFGAPLPELALPEGVLTDGRSFLARGVPALTLRALVDGAFPRGLHSARDSRERLSLPGIERTADFLYALVLRADAHPEELGTLEPPASLAYLPARR